MSKKGIFLASMEPIRNKHHLKKIKVGGQMAQQIKTVAAQSEDLSWIPEPHLKEGEHRPQKVVL